MNFSTPKSLFEAVIKSEWKGTQVGLKAEIQRFNEYVMKELNKESNVPVP